MIGWRKSITRSFIIFKQGDKIKEEKVKMVRFLMVHTVYRYLTCKFHSENLTRNDKLRISRRRRKHNIRSSGLN